MNVLLTGASGFLGKNFILRSSSDLQILALYSTDVGFPEFVSRTKKSNVTAAHCDLKNPEQIAALLKKYGRDWDSCLHLAAKVDIPWSVREPKQDLLLNVGPLLNLLERLRVGKFVYFSSGAVYDGLRGEVH